MKRRCMPLILVLAAVLVLTSIGWLAPSKTSQAEPMPSGKDSFKGKVLLVFTGRFNYFLIEKAQVETRGGQSWLMGKGAASDWRRAGWYKGRTVRIRMEQIESIIEFDDLKKAEESLRAFDESPPDLPAPREKLPLPPPPKDR